MMTMVEESSIDLGLDSTTPSESTTPSHLVSVTDGIQIETPEERLIS